MRAYGRPTEQFETNLHLHDGTNNMQIETTKNDGSTTMTTAIDIPNDNKSSEGYGNAPTSTIYVVVGRQQ